MKNLELPAAGRASAWNKMQRVQNESAGPSYGKNQGILPKGSLLAFFLRPTASFWTLTAELMLKPCSFLRENTLQRFILKKT